ncbi:purine-nucleoside phosphorylase [Psittacicella melopsittaci]|uniref:Purine nucleoside phosphorylase DeoD-type n=1 Tax=Psittacicella melopsittaci TaxID=2028576 RepID=A0A3A1Y7V6_9GAMM|nr:purine-nucleoside phosphorylase [Psittacicella melopsittaci]RIY33298.1 purine-nucleoside phosphorylase [Psittacicella melopsittaci]
MATPHNAAEFGDIAETVLMPGDPLRAKYIAENFLENVTQFTSVRNMYGFTGTYKGKRISIMGHGMGMPSISIYAEELYKFYGVKNIIRIGSAGAVLDDVHVRDVIVVTGASTDSKINRQRFKGHDYSAVASYENVAALVEAAKENNVPVKVGKCFSADLFYSPDFDFFQTLKTYNFLAVEMEAAALFPIADLYGAKAGCILTISDHILREEYTTAEERQTTFTQMMNVALDAAIKVA